jgi:hypothetical protein
VLKSTATILGFLFVLSTAYYLSFWSFFNLNVFPYIAVEDIIKGIAYPLRYGGVWIIGIVLFIIALFAASTIADGNSEGSLQSRARWILGLLVGSFLVAATVYMVYADNNMLGMIFSITLSLVLLFLYYVIDAEHDRNKKAADEEHPLSIASNGFVLYSAILLSINAIVSGQVEARAIHSGKRYNYILTKDMPKDKISTSDPYLIFLGAVSEKYILIDKAENERYIIDKDELPDLKFHYYDYTDSASKAHFRHCFAPATTPAKRTVTATVNISKTAATPLAQPDSSKRANLPVKTKLPAVRLSR